MAKKEKSTKNNKDKTVKEESKSSISKRDEQIEQNNVDSSEMPEHDDTHEQDDPAKFDDQNVMDIENMDEDARNNYARTVIADKVIKYMKIDDLIKQKQDEHKKEIKQMKEGKESLEKFLIEYLDKINEECINVGKKASLIKTESKRSAPIKVEDISTSLIDGFKKFEIYDDEEQIERVVKDFIATIEAKREVKTRKYLKRTKGEDAKKKKNNNNNNDDNNNDNNNNKKVSERKATKNK